MAASCRKYGEEIIYNLNAARAEIHESMKMQSNELSIASTSHNAWNELMCSFNAEYPDVIISNTILRINQLSARDLCSKYDYLLTCPNDLSDPNLQYETLYDDDYPVLLTYPGHHLADRNSVSLSEARDEQFIALDTGILPENILTNCVVWQVSRPKSKWNATICASTHGVTASWSCPFQPHAS